MAYYTCKIRIFLPLNANRTPYTSNTGHYDIQLNKSNVQITTSDASGAMVTRTYKNPIFSYDGKVTVYNASDFSTPDKFLMCSIGFTVDDAAVDKLRAWMTEYCSFTASEGTSDYYRVTQGILQDYKITYSNCFAAAATWCSVMGNDLLTNIYKKYSYPNGKLDEQGYKNYMAWPMFKSFHRVWTFDSMR